MAPKVKGQHLPLRQRLRKALLLVSFLLFPITLYYFSPVLILNAAAEGVVNASLIAFAAQFVLALAVGRLWCGWACPAGALQDLAMPVNNKHTSPQINWIKWAIWIPWIGLIAFLAIKAGGYREINPFLNFEGGITLALSTDDGGPPWYVIYYIILVLMTVLPFAVGRRAACHTVCWMAPFMVLGRRIRNLFAWPSLRLRAVPEACIDCKRCTRDCPMSLEVNQMVRANQMEHNECILCGTCVDTCPKKAIRWLSRARFGRNWMPPGPGPGC